ncbi:MAG TPA: glucose-1-phosphate cytidylyltransferase [Nanoarchaeota archaeon]|nr:MAG: glucose-1-phosphate cytidylyltransferase [archaeon GW2011_AR6]HIH17783.1 glucose-1-phosphate cytidylyltransferase [Nanoarchaeota archaeon]HIH34037.1 glucose-1-phosphate cytidylyltransferase [Nanoarchaeota archaeon]HIH51651.1 glucose-1-phosphate cytidylyltransferase [Nanoarchaeota archaeon]HIH66245.1 glucose-1-phosphate cytidylyltransferase [Nanoarchaeota archaeon]
MKVVILCGGLGTRLREETEFKPKPLVEIGGKPILWHIMKIYSHYGYKDFVLCLGYKGHMIKDYFLKHKAMTSDFTLDVKQGKEEYHSHDTDDWHITFAETGDETNTGGRVNRIEKYIDSDNFFLTYGDGVSDVNIQELLQHHLKNSRIATLTSIQPASRFGVIEFDATHSVNSFKEKPKLDGWINGGFFVFNKEIFRYLEGNPVLEQDPLKTLALQNQLTVYPHAGLWECMDTHRDFEHLNKLWKEGKAFWKVW